MTREEAKKALAAARLPRLDEEDREGLIMEWMVLEPDDSDLQDLPADLREAFLRGEEIVDAGLPIYDPLVLMAIEGELLGVRNEYLYEQLKAMGVEVDSVEGEPEVLEACPCCNYRTIEIPHTYDICPVCYWIDAEELGEGDYSEDNEMTLAQARENFARFGITDESIVEFRLENPDTVYYKA